MIYPNYKAELTAYAKTDWIGFFIDKTRPFPTLKEFVKRAIKPVKTYDGKIHFNLNFIITERGKRAEMRKKQWH